ncbi:MAG: NADH-quinone oxidoreductase subunit M [Candidatus Omnitrophica bacterium]|nr:NADH-quinone oxidoreductase subunit M [Candidatus Omnitrophota bacterium]
MILPDLSWILLIPLLGLGTLCVIPPDNISLIRRVSGIAVFLPFLLSIWFFTSYDPVRGGFQFIEKIPWVVPLGISYHLGIDGINSLLVLLLGIVSLTAVLISKPVTERVKEYHILLLTVIIGTYGAFLSLDIFFFYFFHEVAAIPVFLMIAIWGSDRREHAAMKLTLYLTLGASLSLIGLIALYHATGQNSFDLIQTQQYLALHPLPIEVQYWIFPLIVMGFGITLTLWPFYTWAPEGYAAAPTAVSMLHAGVLKKMGAYAIIRFGIQLMPQAAHVWMPIIAVLAVFNIIFCGLVALTQRDLKYIFGYSSCSHMGYILLGLACFNTISLNGVVFFMFAHGVMVALAFALIGFVFHQTHTRDLDKLGGMSQRMPFIAACFMMAALASAGVPGFANFVAEIMVLLGSWDQFRLPAVLAVLGLVITAIYMLKTIRLGFHGPLKPQWAQLTDAQTPLAKLPYVLLLAVLILVGCWPSFLIRHIGSTTNMIVASMHNSEQ